MIFHMREDQREMYTGKPAILKKLYCHYMLTCVYICVFGYVYIMFLYVYVCILICTYIHVFCEYV